MKKRIMLVLILIVGVFAFAIPQLDDDGLFELASLYEAGKEKAPEISGIRANALPVDVSLSSSVATSDSIQVEFIDVVRDFMADTTSISYKWLNGESNEAQNLPHGIVVDPEGKMWVGFYGNCSREYECPDGEIIHLRALHCFMPDGSPAFFSPMEFFEFPDGSKDTIYYESKTTGACRGLTAMDDGNILFSTWSTVIKIDYRNGHGIAEWNPSLDGFECASLTEAAHDPDEGLIYVGHVTDHKPVYMLDEDLNYLGIAIDTVPTLHRSILARTKNDGTSQIFSGTIFDGQGIFVYESSNPRTEKFQLVDTLANLTEIVNGSTVTYLAWPSCMDWYDRDKGILVYGNYYNARRLVNGNMLFDTADHASKWIFLDVDENCQVGSFSECAMPEVWSDGPYGELFPGKSFTPRGASFNGDYIYTIDFNLNLLQKWQIMDFADTLMLTMTVSDSTDSTVLTYGWTTESTDDFDDGLDEYDTLIAPDGAFDAHFNNTLVKDMRAPNFKASIDWNFDFRNGEGNGPIVITWDNTAFPNYGYFFLRDTVDGSLVNINMRDTSVYVAGEFDPPNLKIMYFYKLKAEFSADIQSGKAPLAVSFNDRSVGIIRNWSWSFGDGGVSREKDPVHVYTEPGVYEVRLIINDGQTTDEIVKTDYVHVSYGDQPGVLNVEDVPDDQGGWVLVNFRRSGYDTARPGTEDPSSGGLEMYSVEISDDGVNWITANSTVAYGSDSYSVMTYTFYDSSAASSAITRFRVIAGMTEGNYMSNVHTGYSVDNIAPAAPEGLSIDMNLDGIALDWDDSEAEDLKHYVVYRSPDGNFNDNGSVVGTTKGSSFTDNDLSETMTYYYRIAAVDIHDNEGKSSETISQTVGLGDLDVIPECFELAQNYPNPFNPTTTLTYGLPNAADVAIMVFDISGKKIMEWTLDAQPAGWHHVIWNGTDVRGDQVSTGMYIYRLQAGDFVDTKKMVLMK